MMNQKKLFEGKEFDLINKAIYFSKTKTLAIGDLHLGHEFTFRESGSLMPATQMSSTKKELNKIFEKLKKEKKEIDKVIFLGDVKHFFSYEKGEKNRFLDLINLVTKYVKRENILVIKGNHEKMAKIADKILVDFYVLEDTIFIHGDVFYEEILDKKIKNVVMGHLHPAIVLQDPAKIKQERYKCYLIGSYKLKRFFILPSFIPTIEGALVNSYISDSHSIIPSKSLQNFEVFIIGKDKIYEFGKLKKLNINN
jgi:putative SbcD/Mre11-related phosphoesterase